MKTVMLLSGVSGAGKTSIAHVFEERGYRVMENIPNAALPMALQEIISSPAYDKTLIIMEIRHAAHAHEIIAKTEGITPYFILLDCQKSELLSRYRLTRHVHPLQFKNLSLEECIDQDAANMKLVRGLADLYIDTTGLSPADLRRIAILHIEGKENKKLTIVFSSFGYKYGIPEDSDIVFDCRNVPNPFWNPELRPYTGLDQPIIDFLEECPEVETAFLKMKDYLEYFFLTAEQSGRSYVSVDIGCSGGQHRSVYFAQRLYEYFSAKRNCVVNHREMHRYKKA